jgi:hypothetical protein
MFGESRSIKPEEDKRPAGVSPSSRQTPTRIFSSPFSSTMARTPEQPRKALEKGSERNDPRKTLNENSPENKEGSPRIKGGNLPLALARLNMVLARYNPPFRQS